jgi:hypothetical protein
MEENRSWDGSLIRSHKQCLRLGRYEKEFLIMDGRCADNGYRHE